MKVSYLRQKVTNDRDNLRRLPYPTQPMPTCKGVQAMNEVIIYKQGKGWRVALNSKTNCQIYLVATKKRATELANELLLKTGDNK